MQSETMQRHTLLWRALVAAEGKIAPALRQNVGQLALDDIRETAAGWMESWDQLRASAPRLEKGITGRQVVEAAQREVAAASGIQSFEHRIDAFFSVMLLHGARSLSAGARQPVANDVEDADLLMQLAQPAFVATTDRALVAAVDASGSVQAPWVRSITELLLDPLPVGLPWGATASRAARGFVRGRNRGLREDAFFAERFRGR